MIGRLVPLLRVIAIGVPVAGAVPTGMNLYRSFKHGIPYAQVAHRLEQYDLCVRNIYCAIDYRELIAAQNAKINVGVCSTSGDISIKVAIPEGKAIVEWIAFDRLKQANALLSLLITPAYAEERGPTASASQSAHASAQVVCQGWEGSAPIVRVVREGARCFKETISPYQGHVDNRTEISCNTSCSATKGR
jgi:hypothetical protein